MGITHAQARLRTLGRGGLPLDIKYDTLLATHAQATRKLRASYA